MDVATPMVTLKFSQNKIKSDDLPLKKARKQGELPFPILSPILHWSLLTTDKVTAVCV